MSSNHKKVSIKGKRAIRPSASAWKAGEPSVFTLANDCVLRVVYRKVVLSLPPPCSQQMALTRLHHPTKQPGAVKGKSVESKSYLESAVSSWADRTFGSLKSEKISLKNGSETIARKKQIKQ